MGGNEEEVDRSNRETGRGKEKQEDGELEGGRKKETKGGRWKSVGSL